MQDTERKSETCESCERLRAALKPFAEWADREALSFMPESGPVVFGGPVKSDLTRAKHALEQLTQEANNAE